ncbi:riboflavin biosynthesis protein RibF [Liquorilactobacillus oeni]|uniref:Riboflavin biosynthesis protein n=1 Tax=Liquorilactobacillus oeni DSM 19972 TaxID=1423777 RepID=A0A0R1MGV0_9LACO|nr:riboflavin biosynthesis protein RibF [Liquorilactobacillus oeni]KRL04282.1 bifunctional riboflavin kinase FMN adenylyltransferase [Liquorilactobacillus oeni DSM 19972]
MQIIKLEEPFDQKKIPDSPIVLAMGFFDGVHRGHQAVIKRARLEAKKRGIKLAIMTLTPHPSVAFRHIPSSKVTYLTSLDHKLTLFEHLGADIGYVTVLNQYLIPMGPQEFVDKYMAALHAQVVVAGEDYTFGKQEIANMELLPKYARKRFEVIKITHLKENGQKISSTKIRSCLDEGKIEEANELLGYPFENDGIIVHGKQIGRKLGFPTINVEVTKGERIPAEGIYAVRVQLLSQEIMGMASIGRNETFGKNNKPTLEINLFDFSQNVYGQKVIVHWYQHLRDQEKYSDVPALVTQLGQDERDTRDYFKGK